MKHLLTALAVLSALAAVGCSGATDDAKVKAGAGVALNPGGKPQNAQQAQYAAQMQQVGNAMNAQMQKDAAAMAAARARAGK